LNEAKQTIVSYVESRMSSIAPNLSAVVGSSTAVKLISMANNLKRLSEMPSCHILLLGSQKKPLEGFSTRTSMPHAGVIFYSKIVQNCPPVCFFSSLFSNEKIDSICFEIGSSSSNVSFSCM